MTTDTPRPAPTGEELLNPDYVNGVINLTVLAHFLAEHPGLHGMFGRWIAGPGGRVPPDVFIAAWVAASHDVVKPDCRVPMNRPDHALALAAYKAAGFRS